jgi:hypothetical protein
MSQAQNKRQIELMGQSVKELLRDTIDKLPADASVEEAMERLYFLSKVERGSRRLTPAKHLLTKKSAVGSAFDRGWLG